MPLEYRQALAKSQDWFTQRTSTPPIIDGISTVPVLVIPIDDVLEEVQPGIHDTGPLPVAENKLTWPPVPQNERHEYTNISFGRTAASGNLDIALAIQGRQGGTSWSRVYTRWANIANNTRVNLLARGTQSASELHFTTDSPLVLYSGEELVVRNIAGSTVLNEIWRIDWLRRIRAPSFRFTVINDAVVRT